MAGHNVRTSRGSASSGAAPAFPGLAGGRPKYVLDPPARQELTPRALLVAARESWRLVIHLVRHIFGMFDVMPKPASHLTSSHPGGVVSDDMLQVCHFLVNDSEARQAKLESKATGLLSLIALVIPLTASAAVFIRQNQMPPQTAVVTLGLNLFAMLCFIVGLLAALRAVSVRGGSTLFLNAVIDPDADQMRSYSADFFGRGLLHAAATRQAICDHIADFVRGAQVFLVLGVLFAAAAAVPVLFNIRFDDHVIHGTVSVDPTSLRALQESVTTAATESTEQIGRLESDIQLLKAAQSNARVQTEIDRLSKELADMRVWQEEQASARRRSN